MKLFRKMSIRPFVFSITAVIVATVTVGGTLAYMTVKTNAQINNLNPGVADIEVSEPNGSSYALTGSNSDVNKIVTVTNVKRDRAVPVYVRVRLVPIIRFTNGDEGTGEQAAVTYQFVNPTKWTEKQSDGYYYYKGILQPGTTTEDLINKAMVAGGLKDGKKLEIQVVADSIQTVADAEQTAWGRKFDNGRWDII